MSKAQTVKKVPKADEPPGTVSLTRHLIGVDGETLEVVDVDSDGEEVRHKMDVRRAVLLSLLQGSGLAERKEKLNESEKLRCFTLSQAVANEQNTGYTFKPEDIILIKKLAALRLPVEPFGSLLQIIDPTAFDK